MRKVGQVAVAWPFLRILIWFSIACSVMWALNGSVKWCGCGHSGVLRFFIKFKKKNLAYPISFVCCQATIGHHRVRRQLILQSCSSSRGISSIPMLSTYMTRFVLCASQVRGGIRQLHRSAPAASDQLFVHRDSQANNPDTPFEFTAENLKVGPYFIVCPAPSGQCQLGLVWCLLLRKGEW